MDTWEGSRLNEAKDILAYELTKLVHGEAEAEAARASSRALFSGAAEGDAPTVAIDPAILVDGAADIISLLVAAGLVPSRSEGRRAVEQGGVTANGEKVADLKATFTKEALAEGILLRRGKKAYKKVTL